MHDGEHRRRAVERMPGAAPTVLDMTLTFTQRFRGWAHVWLAGLRPSLNANARELPDSSHPSTRNLTLDSPADAYGLVKHSKYDEGFKGTPFLFCAAVLETTGGFSAEALSFFR